MVVRHHAAGAAPAPATLLEPRTDEWQQRAPGRGPARSQRAFEWSVQSHSAALRVTRTFAARITLRSAGGREARRVAVGPRPPARSLRDSRFGASSACYASPRPRHVHPSQGSPERIIMKRRAASGRGNAAADRFQRPYALQQLGPREFSHARRVIAAFFRLARGRDCRSADAAAEPTALRFGRKTRRWGLGLIHSPVKRLAAYQPRSRTDRARPPEARPSAVGEEVAAGAPRVEPHDRAPSNPATNDGAMR